MSPSLLEIARFDTPRCEGCGQIDKQPYSALAGKQKTSCSICGHSIPLTDQEWLKEFTELVQGIQEQRPA